MKPSLCILLLLCGIVSSAVAVDEPPVLVRPQRYSRAFLDQEGTIVVDDLVSAAPFRDGYAVAALRGGERVVLDTTGMIVARDVAPFCSYAGDGIVPFEERGRIGYRTLDGEVVVEPRFVAGTDFIDGRAVVAHQPDVGTGFFAVIDEQGRPVFRLPGEPTRRASLSSYSDGVLMWRGSAYDTDGSVLYSLSELEDLVTRAVIPEEGRIYGFSGAFSLGDVHEGRVRYTVAYRRSQSIGTMSVFRSGYLGIEGEVVTQAVFNEARPFSSGRAAVRIDGAWGFIDRDGNMAVDARYDEVKDFVEDLTAVRLDDRWGYIDRDGVVVVEPRFAGAEPFEDGMGLVLVLIDEVWDEHAYGYVGPNGDMVIEPRFRDARSFRHSLAQVADAEKAGYINKDGTFVWIHPYFKTVVAP